MPLIAHLADLHLGKSQYHYSFREEDVYFAFKQAVDKILEEHADAVIIAGDVFDNPRPYNKTILKFKEIVEPLHKKNIPVIIVRGDHDTPKLRDRGVLEIVSSFHDNIKVLEPAETIPEPLEIMFGENKIAFWGAPYVPPTYRKKWYDILFQKIKADKRKESVKIVVGHFPIKQYMFFEESIDKATLPRNIHYYAMGHIHDRIIDTLDSSVIAYPGSLEIMDRKEITIWKKKGKGFYITDFSSKEPLIHKIDIDVRPQDTIVGEYPGILEEIKRKIEAISGEKKLILHIDVTCLRNDKQKAITSIREIVGDKAYTRIRVHEKETIVTKPAIRRKASGEKEIVSRIVGDTEIAELLIDLKNCLSEKRECSQIIKKILEKREYWDKKIGPLYTRQTTGKKSGGKGLFKYI